LNIWSLEQDTVQDVFVAAIGDASAAMRGNLRESTAPPAEQPAWFAWNFRVAVGATPRQSK